MTEAEMVARIADLETTLRLVIFCWIVSIVMLARLVPTDDEDQQVPRCPMCFHRHDPHERCA